jgi:hypothetical protein
MSASPTGRVEPHVMQASESWSPLRRIKELGSKGLPIVTCTAFYNSEPRPRLSKDEAPACANTHVMIYLHGWSSNEVPLATCGPIRLGCSSTYILEQSPSFCTGQNGTNRHKRGKPVMPTTPAKIPVTTLTEHFQHVPNRWAK